MKRNILTIALIVASLCVAVAYAPAQDGGATQPTLTVADDLVTLDGDWGYVVSGPAEDITLVIGTGIGGMDRHAAESTVGGGIAWRLAPGTYTIEAAGRPADYNQPSRTHRTFEVVIEDSPAPTRADQIRAAATAYYLAQVAQARALAELQALDPTDDEMLAALGAQGGD